MLTMLLCLCLLYLLYLLYRYDKVGARFVMGRGRRGGGIRY
jgi:hypothetical protein